MIWGGRIDLAEYVTPIAVMPSSHVGYIRVLLGWSFIQRPGESVMLQIRGEKKQNNMSDQINSREALKVWRMIQF